MKKQIKSLTGVILALFIIMLMIITPVSATTMKDILGVDFTDQKFAISFDLNVAGPFPSGGLASTLNVTHDYFNSSNPRVTTDGNPTFNQEFYMYYNNFSGIETSYLALQQLSGKFVLNILGNTYTFGSYNGTAPFQSLLQHYKYQGADVLVANTFRGFLAYTSSGANSPIISSTNVYLGYSVVESHLLSIINTALSGASLPTIPTNYNSIPEYSANSFGMNYTNMFMVFQDTNASSLGGLGSLSSYLNGFDFAVTGGNIQAAALFKYINFTYTAQLDPSSNSTYTKVNIVTKYNLGPIELLITRDSNSVYNSLVADTNLGINTSNSMYLPTQTYSISPGGSYSTFSLSISTPALAIYTGAAARARISQAAIKDGASGFGIAAVTSTNVWKADSSVSSPSYYNNNGTDVTLPLMSGSNTIYSTSFVGKSNYQLNYGNGTTSTYNIILANPTFTQLGHIINISNVFSGYFDVQSTMTSGFTAFFINQLGLSSSSNSYMSVSQTSYMTMTEMPVWSGYQITQDPTYSAVSAVSATSSSPSGSNGNTSKPTPGFEFVFLIAGLATLVIYRHRKK